MALAPVMRCPMPPISHLSWVYVECSPCCIGCCEVFTLPSIGVQEDRAESPAAERRLPRRQGLPAVGLALQSNGEGRVAGLFCGGPWGLGDLLSALRTESRWSAIAASA